MSRSQLSFFLRLYLCFLSLSLNNLFLFGQVNLSSGLVASYNFNGNATDNGGNNFNGVLINGTSFTNDRFGNPNSAAFFDGIDDYVKVVDNGSFSTPNISISLWFKTNSNALQNLIGKRKFENDFTQSGGAQYQFFINYDLYPGIGSNLVGNNSSCTNVSNSSYINTADQICQNRWYHAVITYDGSFHKIYINGVLRLNQSTSFTQFLQCNSELRFGAWWSGGTLPYSGVMDDIRWYNRAINANEVLALFDNYSFSSSADFSYTQSSCNPKSIQFASITNGATGFSWDFGNGTFNSTNGSPTVNYNSFGNYNVKLKVQTSFGCIDSVSKTISINVQQENSIIANSNIGLCSGESLSIALSDTGISGCWQPSNGVLNGNSLSPILSPASTTTYIYTTQILGSNLVLNGDFSAGNTLFQSDYVYTFPNNSTGEYWVGDNPISWNANMSNCTDHTGNNGKMLIVNGATTIGSKIWGQTISVQPNTNYMFSIWVQSVNTVNPAKLKFTINGSTLSSNINASSATCQWNRFYVTWNSGNTSFATITLINNNSVFVGNDFALDDISFNQITLKQDSIKITVVPKPLVSATSSIGTICQSDSVQLNANGASNFSWSPSNGLSNSNIANPKASPLNTTIYTVTGFNIAGCSDSKQLTITVLPKPQIIKSADADICKNSNVQLSATAVGSVGFNWIPAASLNNSLISNPLATPIATTTYLVTVTGSNSCISQDSIKVVVRPKPTVSVRADTSVCNTEPVVLNTTNVGATTFSWVPISGLSSSVIASPVATPSVTTRYLVTATNAVGCSDTASMLLTINNAPVITKSANTNICKDSIIQIAASGINAVSYSWTPTNGLSNSFISSPFANPISTTNYYVTVTGANGCSQKDSVLVTVLPKPSIIVRGDTSVCNKTPILVSSNSANATIFSWQPVIGLSNPVIANPIATPSISTQYIVTASNGICSVKDTFSLGIKPLPVIAKSIDTTICKTGTATLNVSGGVNYSWSPNYNLSSVNSDNVLAKPDTTTYYFITTIGANACTNKDSIKVTVNPKPLFGLQPLNATICKNDSIALCATGGDLYQWIPTTNILSTSLASTKVYPTFSTIYKVIITNNVCKLSDTLSTSVNVNPLPVTAITKSNDIDCANINSRLNVSGGINYSWQQADGIAIFNTSNPTVNPSQTTTYLVKVTGANGCSTYDSINVKVDYAITKALYLMPNAFTPNKDGLNDCFGLKYWGGITKLEFNIYNRFGQIVFQTNNPTDCWNGKFKGIDADFGTYVYQIKATTICGGDIYRKGTFVLLR